MPSVSTSTCPQPQGPDRPTDFSPAVFSKSYCPYCTATKSLLTEHGAKAYIIELDQVGTFSPSKTPRDFPPDLR
jgi:hypothetical protein